MSKKLLSVLLVLTMLLGMLPVSAFATKAPTAQLEDFTQTSDESDPTDSGEGETDGVPVKSGEDISVDMTLNQWLDMDLSQYFTAPEGEEPTYEVSHDGETWQTINETFRYYPAGDGVQTVYYRACAGGLTSEILTLTAKVKEAPSKVTVSFSVSQGVDKFFQDGASDVMVPITLTVPYFDLALYGMEDCYYNPECYATANGELGSGTVGDVSNADGVVTLMHIYIYATEKLYLGWPDNQCGKGNSYNPETERIEDESGKQILSWTGSAGSTYMSLWNHGTNLNYYVDWTYPLGGPKWGSTADQIALYGGEVISLHAIEDANVQGSNFAFFTLDGAADKESYAESTTVFQSEKVELTLVKTTPDWDAYTTGYEAFGSDLYYINVEGVSSDLGDWNKLGKTDANGTYTVDTTELTPGSYYIASRGAVDTYTATETAPAVIELTVKEVPTPVEITITQGEEESLKTVTAADTGLVYQDVKVYFAETPEFGSWTFDDNLSEKLGKTRRHFSGGGNNLPYTIGTGHRSLTSQEAIESTYGTIEGLTGENTLLFALEVSSVKSNGWQKDTLQYVLVVQVPIVRVEAVHLNNSELALRGEDTLQLAAEVLPENASYATVTWKSDNEKVAEVTSDGLVSAWADGTATITATADGVEAKCVITVTDGIIKPVAVYTGGDWPQRGACLSKISVGKQSVVSTVVNGNNYFVTLDSDTPDDAALSLTMEMSGSGAYLLIDDVVVEREDLTKAYTHLTQLTDGNLTVKIGVAPSYYTPEDDLLKRSSSKTFYFSNNGKFPVAPELSGSSSASIFAAVGEKHTVDLTNVFKTLNDKPLTWQVSVDGAEAVACDASYTYLCETAGTHKLVFNAVNQYGTSPDYTVTVSVLDTKAILKVNYKVDGGEIEWFAFTDEQGNPLPDGTTYQWDAETTTVTILQPMDINKSGKVKTWYKLVKTDPDADFPILTGSTQITGAGSHWDTAIRNQQTDTLSNGQVEAKVYLYTARPSNADNRYTTITFNYKRVMPETAFEYKITDNHTYTLVGDNGGVNSHAWIMDGNRHYVYVALTEETPDDALISCLENGKSVTLADGAGEIKWADSLADFGWGNYYGIFFQKDNLPTLAEGAEAEVSVTIPCLETYSTDLSAVFTDKDANDTLTYQVKVGSGSWTNIEGSQYSFLVETKQTYTLQFRAYDGFVYSKDVQTVTIEATNATQTYDAIVNLNAESAEFYCFTAVEDGQIFWNDQVPATVEGSVWTLAVPQNVSRLVAKVGEALTVFDINANTPATLCKTTFAISTFGDGTAQANVTVTAPEGIETPVGDHNIYYLIPAEGYTFTAVPTAEFSDTWANAKLTDQTVTRDGEVEITLNVRSAKVITIDSDADLTVYYQSKYYVLEEVEPAVVIENNDKTTTYYYACYKNTGYSAGYSYFARKADLIDKCGYLTSKGEYSISWIGEKRTANYRADYDVNVGQGNRGDDSILVNVNSQNHLILKEGETFRLRSSRIWEVINSDTENVMIEPEYTYTGYDDSIIQLKNANESLTDQVCGTGGNNWMDITAVGSGVTFLEVAYEAMHMVDGYASGAWGGAGAAPDDFVWNATDPNRTALIVVQTDGNAATDVTFGIDCMSSNGAKGSYNAEKAVQWDAEFDTLYFISDCGQLELSPSVESGSIASVAVSSDKGQTWTTLTAVDGVYTADIYPGNNIIRVTKDDGTTAYQLVRGDQVTVEITIVDDVNGNGKADLGDTVKLQLYGLHNPVGKMSGIYNPGFSYGQRLTYSLGGETVQQYDQYQYNFVTNAYLTFTIPTEPAASYALTDGYINFNIFGDLPGSHRNLTDDGRAVNTTASSDTYTRCLLPEIVVYTCDHSFKELVKTVAPTCYAEGYTEYLCLDCGTVLHEDVTDKLGHDMDSVVTEPTHDKMGYTTHTCSVCGYSFVDSWTQALEHTYVSEITREATCTEDGEMTFTCVCGESYTQVIPKKGHICTGTEVAPTCESFGYTAYQCQNCDFGYISQIQSATGHTRSVSGKVEAGFHTEGYTGDTVCSVCDKVLEKGEKIAALGCPSEGFADVETDAWYHEAVDYAIDSKLMNGVTATSFAPNGETTRSMLATLLYRMAGEPDVTGLENPFTDVPANAWYNKAVVWAYSEGIVTGATATTFNPDGTLTREQLAVMLWRYADKPEADVNVLKDYTDANCVGAYAADAVAWAVMSGLINGMGNQKLEPTGSASRAQIATILMRFIEN